MPDALDLDTPGAWEQTESLHLLRQVMAVAEQMRHAVSARVDLSVSELHALEHLAFMPRGPAEIARLLDVSTAASTGIVDRLVSKGHVTRRPHEHDRRRTEVVITPSARREVISQMGSMFVALDRLDASLTDAEREVVVRYLAGVLAASRLVLETGPEIGAP
jgi:DNA-binding MarR family transcriptional regulator